jgi:hypothetical protein
MGQEEFAGLDDVHAGGRARAGGVAAAECRQHRGVPSRRCLGPAGNAGIETAGKIAGDRAQNPDEFAGSAGLVDDMVELVVVLLDEVIGGGLNGADHAFVNAGQLLEGVGSQAPAASDGEFGTENGLDPEQVDDVLAGQFGDHESTAGFELHETLTSQRLERLSYRSHTDSEFNGKPFKPKELSGADLPVHDLFTNSGRNLVTELRPQAQRPLGPRHRQSPIPTYPGPSAEIFH